ncbi:hypothetical protein BRADI_2g60515v3 [Brachypodium distachyon]|uniref:Uncharacterized protein n=1 Tax=Brachypodium distachyon TaxID=15368 RepID=A0A2K2DH25_BRADI|nr:hypothetical protein BRADI_2g60515v3 [Brachypodium distachyon]
MVLVQEFRIRGSTIFVGGLRQEQSSLSARNSEATLLSARNGASKPGFYGQKIQDFQNLETAPNARNSENAVADYSLDVNTEDCMLCGMDRTSVCCDCCPSA